jgi:HAE1 family hydrophobic/amphiphilic exporter-1
VGDVADVVDGWEDVRYLAEVNGLPSITVGVQKQSGANTVDVARRLRAEVERINGERKDLHLTVFSDSSEFIRQSIDNVEQSAYWGSLLALAILYLFLRSMTSTAIIGVSIPVSIIACFALLYFGGLTLNQMTFGGLALGVGMMVDNAIVVMENIVRKREETRGTPEDAAGAGASEVAGAMLASTLTTCVVFIPLVFMQSVSGALFRSLALVVIFCQVCSLVVAFTVVPVLAARMLRKSTALGARPLRPRSGAIARLERRYGRLLQLALAHRGRVFAVTGVLVVAALVLWRQIPVELAPQTDADEIDVELEMAQGTNMAVVRAYPSSDRQL